jgi:heme-degrading monooxygenase HmoA
MLSHTVWENRAVFGAWTKSEAFRAARSDRGKTSRCNWIIRIEGFEVRQTVGTERLRWVTKGSEAYRGGSRSCD